MTNEELYNHCAALKPAQRRELGILDLNELVAALHQTRRRHCSKRYVQRRIQTDADFPVIRQPSSKRARCFFRFDDVQRYLDKSVNALRDHFDTDGDYF